MASQPPGMGTLKVAVGVATTGRAEMLLQTIARVRSQTRPADLIVVCPAQPSDCAGLAEAFPDILIVTAGRGLPRQRNAILDALGEADIVLFIDDDFVLAPDYLQALHQLLIDRPDVIMATGRVLADGARGPGISLQEGIAIVEQDFETRPAAFPAPEARPAAYGCNMAIRLEPVRRHKVRFDERLPLYGWLEDIDFSGRLKALEPSGQIIWAPVLRGVHLGAKSGRQSGVRLGYSQVVNPVFIARKGALPRGFLYKFIRRNVIANLVRALAPEPHVDRIGRLKGNLYGFWDVLRRCEDPEKIERLGR